MADKVHSGVTPIAPITILGEKSTPENNDLLFFRRGSVDYTIRYANFIPPQLSDASGLTAGILPTARLGNNSIPLGKLVTISNNRLLGNVSGTTANPHVITIDRTTLTNNDNRIPSSKAVKDHVDASVPNLTVRGNVSGGTNPPTNVEVKTNLTPTIAQHDSLATAKGVKEFVNIQRNIFLHNIHWAQRSNNASPSTAENTGYDMILDYMRNSNTTSNPTRAYKIPYDVLFTKAVLYWDNDINLANRSSKYILEIFKHLEGPLKDYNSTSISYTTGGSGADNKYTRESIILGPTGDTVRSGSIIINLSPFIPFKSGDIMTLRVKVTNELNEGLTENEFGLQFLGMAKVEHDLEDLDWPS